MESSNAAPSDATPRTETGEPGIPTGTSTDAEALMSGDFEEPASRTTMYAMLGGLALFLIFLVITAGLYMLGGEDESALERMRDIAVIYIVLISMILVILLAAATAALIYLVLQIKNQVIPLLEETSATVTRVRGTTEFMTDEAVKPIISFAGKVAQWRAMMRVISGK